MTQARPPGRGRARGPTLRGSPSMRTRTTSTARPAGGRARKPRPVPPPPPPSPGWRGGRGDARGGTPAGLAYDSRPGRSCAGRSVVPACRYRPWLRRGEGAEGGEVPVASDARATSAGHVLESRRGLPPSWGRGHGMICNVCCRLSRRGPECPVLRVAGLRRGALVLGACLSGLPPRLAPPWARRAIASPPSALPLSLR